MTPFHLNMGGKSAQDRCGKPNINKLYPYKALWEVRGPRCDYFLKHEKLWCCGYAALVRP